MLWNKTSDATSMPKWYARQCFVQGDVCVDEDGHLDLSSANTQFATGEAVMLISDSPIGGLANEGVYYLRREPSDPDQYHYSLHASRDEAEGEGEGIALTAGSGLQMFVDYDVKETTADATEGFALVLVDLETAKQKVDGLVSPGWWRIRKFETSTGTSRIHRELLVSFRVEPVESEEGDDTSFSGGGTTDAEGRKTPSVTVSKIGEWSVNAYNEFTVEVSGNDFAPSTFALLGLEGAELIEQQVDSSWVTVSNPEAIPITGSVQRFRVLLPYVEGGSSEVSLGVEVSGDGFDAVSASGTVTIKTEPTASTVGFATVDSAIAL